VQKFQDPCSNFKAHAEISRPIINYYSRNFKAYAEISRSMLEIF
jgi:hypothetical protein